MLNVVSYRFLLYDAIHQMLHVNSNFFSNSFFNSKNLKLFCSPAGFFLVAEPPAFMFQL